MKVISLNIVENCSGIKTDIDMNINNSLLIIINNIGKTIIIIIVFFIHKNFLDIKLFHRLAKINSIT